MEENLELINFLNVIHEGLGEMYTKKKLRFDKDFDAEHFVMTDDKIKKHLIFNMSNTEVETPELFYMDKKNIKTYFKNSLKNIKKLETMIKGDESVNSELKKEVLFYLKIFECLMKNAVMNTTKTDAVEEQEFLAISKINPPLMKLLQKIETQDPDLQIILDNIKNNYKFLTDKELVAYLEEERELLVKKKKRQRERENEELLRELNDIENELKKSKKKTTEKTTQKQKTEKKVQKTAKKVEKTTQKSKNNEKTVVKEEKITDKKVAKIEPVTATEPEEKEVSKTKVKAKIEAEEVTNEASEELSKETKKTAEKETERHATR